ncbi:hypothetical protein LTR83_001100 [Exophiala xenobiotica]|nr:hypothetical protein LTS06_008036 [Exophiala xenobiotica]KAK5283498.1 hypothetical protein LTR40_001641 [Exophiala xenobiotica]KAK5405951.1 hypothetical protein LTR90_010762 [Exophiala xenobiotica]KAK5506547.1 hypothetical protein LTR83_001100 [Exophiala xenobiotica]KAK5523251.1 hypothetical protein LTR21_001099 [Exophiala xenobiotica]
MEDLSIYHDSNLLHNQEDMLKYRPGGYHPVRLGGVFKDGRYKIHHKLGWGGFSTVWLARDNESDKWVAVKIKTANSPKQSRELHNLQSLTGIAQGNLSSKGIVRLLDHFFHQGPNGTHQCLVFELLGPTVDAVVGDIHQSGDVLDPETILRMSKQLLQAITFMHEVGYTHADLSGRNVAFTSNMLSRLTEEGLFEVLGPPETEELCRRDGGPLNQGVPCQLVKATGWDNWTDEDDEDIRIFDLGEAFLNGAVSENLPQPSHLRAPETIFMDSCDSRHDLWRAGIMIYTFLFGSVPFQYWYDDVLVAQMIHFVEELPMEWQQKWDDMRLKSGRDYSLRK